MEQKQIDEMEDSFLTEEFIAEEDLLEEEIKNKPEDYLELNEQGEVKEELQEASEIKEEIKEELEVKIEPVKKEKKAPKKAKSAKKTTAKAKKAVTEIVEDSFTEKSVKEKTEKLKKEKKTEEKSVSDPWSEPSPSMFKEVSTWKAITGIVVILLVFSVFTQGFKFAEPTEAITLEEAEATVLDYINNYLLQPPYVAKSLGAEESSDLYMVTLSVAGQEAESYITKDGKIFFPQGFDLTEQLIVPEKEDLAVIEVNTEGDPFLGDENAPVVIVEFSDYECPFCGKFYEETYPQLKKQYIDTGKVKLVFRDFPLDFHPEAEPAALASECADEQGKFWEYHYLLFENQQELSTENYLLWAEELGLDIGQFTTCFDEQTYLNEVAEDILEGREYGITGTPAFLINGRLINGAQPFSVFEKEIEAALSEEEFTAPEVVEEPVIEEPVPTTETKEFTLTAKKWIFTPNKFTVSQGDLVKLTIIPENLDFTFSLPELGVEEQITATTTVSFTANQAGTFTFSCGSCEDWRGMTGSLTVE